MRKLAGCFAALLWTVSGSVGAAGVSYNYVEAYYLSSDLDDTDVDADGVDIGFSGLIAPNAFLTASYTDLESDRFSGPFGGTFVAQGRTYAAGFGVRQALNPTVDVFAGISFIYAEARIKGSGGSEEDDDTGFGLNAGLRAALAPSMEGLLRVDYVDVFDDDSTALTGGLLLHLSPAISLGAAYSIDDDAKTWRAGARFNF